MFNGQKDLFVVEISGSIEVRSEFRSNSRLLEFADVPVLFSKGNNESFLPGSCSTLQVYCGTRFNVPFSLLHGAHRSLHMILIAADLFFVVLFSLLQVP